MDAFLWFEKFINSEFMDELILNRLREDILLNEEAIRELQSQNNLKDYEKQDLENCLSWKKSLEDVYSYFGGNLNEDF